MLTDKERVRLGELKSRVDLSPEEQIEFDKLHRKAYEHAYGTTDSDFDAASNAEGNYSIIPLSDKAKQEIENTLVPRDRESFDRRVTQLEGKGFTVRKRAA